ncbi:MAG TPA: hypothetical protein DG761_11380 [Gammaproteobacteria bacterium]|nr:hypothetical protein [Gammaproteobacteria bacterium]
MQNPASTILSRSAHITSQSQYLNPVYLWANEAEGLLGGGQLGTGKSFYVDSGASGTAVGTSLTDACLTIDAAIGLCTASRGDFIYVAQGHAETVSSATGLVCDIAGVSIIGIGNGSLIPTISLGTATTAKISVTAANVRLSNLKIVSALADLAEGIDPTATADGLVVDNCIFTDGGAALELVIGINVTADCDNIRIINNRFNSTAASDTTNAIVLAGGSDNSVIAGNIIYGTYTAGGVLASAAASVNLTVLDNVIGAIDAIGWDSHASTTGVFARNLIGANTTSIAAALTGLDAMFCWENYVTGALNASGIIIPAVDGD